MTELPEIVGPTERKLFGEWLVYNRRFKRMSQWDLAHAIGVHERTVVSWEAGDTSPNDGNYQKLVSLFECYYTKQVQNVLTEVSLDDLLNEIQRRGYSVSITSKG